MLSHAGEYLDLGQIMARLYAPRALIRECVLGLRLRAHSGFDTTALATDVQAKRY